MSRDYAFEAAHERWEMALLDAHIDGPEAANDYPPVVELGSGRWFDTEKKRIITDAEGWRRYGFWEKSTPYWERDAAITAWRERK